MRRVLFALVLLCCAFASCADRRKGEQRPFPEYEIKGKLYENAEIFAMFPDIIGIDSLLIVYSASPMVSGRFMTVYSPRENMKEVGDFGTHGRGPGEFLSIDLNSVNGNHLFARHTNMNEVAVLELSGADSGRVAIKEAERLGFKRIMYDNIAFEDRRISYLDDSHFVAVSFGGPGMFFSLYDERMNGLPISGTGLPERKNWSR